MNIKSEEAKFIFFLTLFKIHIFFSLVLYIGPTGIILSVGLNIEMTTGAECDRQNLDGNEEEQKCYMGLKGTTSIGVTWQPIPGPLKIIPKASVYLEGSFDLETSAGIPCSKELITNNKDGSWNSNILPNKKCGHARLFWIWVTHFLGKSNIFNNKEFTGAMYSSAVKNAAELRAESRRSEDQEEVMNIVASLNEKKNLHFKPKNHPLYRAGKIWNIQFHQYWFNEVIQNNGK